LTFCFFLKKKKLYSRSIYFIFSQFLSLLNVHVCPFQHPLLHLLLQHLVNLRILRQPKPPHKLAGDPFNPTPLVVLLLLLFGPLPTYLQRPTFVELDLHLFLPQPQKIGLDNVSFRGFFPIDANVGKSRGFM